MSRITKTFTQSEVWTIPSNATNIRFAIGGAAGGSCPGVRNFYSPSDPNHNATQDAQCQLNPQSTGQYGQWIVGDLKSSMAGTNITFVRGLKGDDNLFVYGSATDPGAPGGAGYHDGGDGGAASDTSATAPYQCTRSGGAGGGGSSVFLIGTTVVVEAGGGGGAGGANTSSLRDPDSVNSYSKSTLYSLGFDGGNGGLGGASNSAGSGGGGGGYSNQSSGDTQVATQMKYGDGGIANNGAYGRGFPGIGGSGFVNANYVDGFPTSYNSNEAQHTKELQGTAEISYETQTVIEDFNWTTRSAQENGVVGGQGSDPNTSASGWTNFLRNTNIGGNEAEGNTVSRTFIWEINFNNTGFQEFNTAVDDSADVYIDNVFQFSLNTYNSNDVRTTPNQITAGQHTLKIEHVNTGGPYGVAMDWTGYSSPAPPTVVLDLTDNNDNPITSIYKGQNAKITFSASVQAGSSNITSNTFTATDINGNVSNPINPVGNSGVYFPAPTVTTTYEYSATNDSGTTTESVTLTVIDDTPVITLTSDATNDTIYKGQDVTITWSATANTTITSTSMTGVASPGTSGSETFTNLTVSSAYVFSATNISGTGTATLSIIVVDDTPVVSLITDDADNIINIGESVTLTWSATANTTVDSTTLTGVASPGTSGSVEVFPTVGTTTYTFTATNDSGTGTVSVTITTNLPAPTASLTSNDSDNTIISGDTQSGDPVTLTWSGTGSNITNYSMTGVTNPGASGSVVVSPNTTTTYTYSLQNATASASDSVTITVYNRPTITLTAPTNTIARGTGVVLTWATTGDASSIQWTNGDPVPSNTNINGTAFVSPQNSTQYCVVASGNGGVSETVCYNINVIVPDPSITDFDTTFTDDGTAYIPPYAINVTADIAGASGGQGGTDSGGSGGGGGGGRRALIFFPDYVERTFTLRLGNAGVNGFGCVANSGAGAGGSSNVAAGGSGGRSGPSGCSGGGGGGGGASAIFDSLKNGYVTVVAGGGGGGGASWNRSATSGQTGLGMTNGNINNISTGSNGADCPNDGGGGGGGGGGANPGAGGAFGLDNNVGGYGGKAGGSAYDNSYCSFNTNTGTRNFGDGFARVRYDIGSPEITSFTSDLQTIIRGVGVTLSWTSLFSITGSIDQGVGSVQVPNGSILVYPQNTGTYTLTVIGPGGINTDTATLSITVYIPPVLTLTLSSPTIIVGGGTQLSWSTSGDADTITWVSGGVTNTNLTSNTTVSPSVTTTYSGYASGLGGTSPLASVTLIVYYPPTLLVNYPAQIDYGQQAQIDYSGDYANSSVVLNVTYNYDYVAATTDTADLNKSNSAEFGSDSGYSGIYDTEIVYTERGPLSVSYTITATGNGGSATQSFTIPINVDVTPDNMTIEESEDLFKDQVPVVTPDSEILGDYYEVQDVDILVEVKSDYPINVDIDANENWQQVRQI